MRNMATPDVPAIAEYVPGYEVVSSQALFVPAKKARETVQVGLIQFATLADRRRSGRGWRRRNRLRGGGFFARGAGKAAQVGNRPMEHTHQVSSGRVCVCDSRARSSCLVL